MIASHLPIRTFEDFLAAVLERHREEDDRSIGLVSFLLAVPESWNLAYREATRDGYGRIAAVSALSLGTAAALVRLLATGPLGLVATGIGAAAAFLVARPELDALGARRDAIAALVDRYRIEFADLATERDTRSLREAQWDVMMDGLLSRFDAELGSRAFDPAAIAGFAEHVVGATIPPARFAGAR